MGTVIDRLRIALGGAQPTGAVAAPRLVTAGLGALVLAGLVGVASAQCCGDCDGNGSVSIAELITAVNRALNECPLPPVSSDCPANFNHDNMDGSRCRYVGEMTSDCFGRTLMRAAWSSDGRSTIVAVFLDEMGSIGLVATQRNGTNARVTEVSSGPDFRDSLRATGYLGIPSRMEFVAAFDAGPCLDGAFEGTFQDLLTGNASGSAASVEPLPGEIGDEMRRLREELGQ